MKLITEELKKQLPKPYSQENEDDPIVYAHFFGTNGDWYILEYNPEDNCCFALCCLLECELGYVSVDELESLRFPPFGTPIERDLYWEPRPLSVVKAGAAKRYGQ